jgi:hypothetical protein
LSDLRIRQLQQWLAQQFPCIEPTLKAMNGDAGFRRYFRFSAGNQQFIAVDSPSEYCNNSAFIAIQKKLSEVQINVPEIVAVDEKSGFFCLSDLGDNLLSNDITLDNMAQRYQQAINLLPQIAQLTPAGLPCYDAAFIKMELIIFIDWLLVKHLDITLTMLQQKKLQQSFELLIDNALEQPQVTMHRDFHSRNIMRLSQGELAVIDFQDAVVGPITYDVVSLLRDCYVKWPGEKISPLFCYFCQLMSKQLSLPAYSDQQWLRWFDLMGLQRHIKASGIFARLYHRDGKGGYLADIPLTLSYIVEVSGHYPELQFLHDLVKKTVLPAALNKAKIE